MSTPLISVIMPVHNGQATLHAAIDSILAQDTPDWELWIVNDASTDETGRIIGTYAQRDPRIHTLTLPQQMGVGYARQQALQHALGNYIAHLDADDIAHPQRLRLQRTFMQAHANVVLCATDVQRFTHDTQHHTALAITDKAVYPQRDVSRTLRYHLCMRNPIVSSSVMYLRQTALDSGGFDTTLNVAEDYALFCELLKHRPGCFLPVRLTSYRVHADSLSHRQANRMKDLGLRIGYHFSMHWLKEPVEQEIPAWYRWVHSHGNEGDISLRDAISACQRWLKLAWACPDSPKTEALALLLTCMGKAFVSKLIGHQRAVSLFRQLHDSVIQPKSGL